MKRMFGFFLFAVIICLTGTAFGAEKSVAKAESLSSGLEDQSGVAVTIYNVNLGLVKDQRSDKPAAGSQEN